MNDNLLREVLEKVTDELTNADDGWGYKERELSLCLADMGSPYDTMDEDEVKSGLLRLFSFGCCGNCGRWDTMFDGYCFGCSEELGQ